jgi:signal transduction histidine kinase
MPGRGVPPAPDRRPDKPCQVPFHGTSLHDLGGPVNQVSTMLDLFQRKYCSVLDPDAQAMLDLMRTSSGNLQNLWRGLQTYVRQTGSPQTPQRCDPAALLEAAMTSLESGIRRMSADITHGTLPAVVCNPNQLSIVFTALLDNALKFRGEERPEIRIAAVSWQDWCEFSFRDNGIGIEPKDFEVVFHLFKRLNGDRYPGAGVGLTIARGIVESHGGRIWLAPARGSEIHFTLPLAV